MNAEESAETSEQDEINPWADILTSPRKTIDWIAHGNSNIWVTLILIYLGGVYFGLTQAIANSVGDRKTITEIFTSAFLISGLGGLITYHIYIWVIDFSASWFGGKGNFQKTQVAFAWSKIPSILGIFIIVAACILFEEELFMSETPTIDSTEFLRISYLVFMTIIFMIAIWYIVLLVVTLSEVQRLSIGKVILTLLTSTALFILPIIALVFLFTLE